MNDDQAVQLHAPSRQRGNRALLVIGALLFFVGPALYFVQFHFQRLSTPWYVPILASVGVAFILMSAWRRWGFLRSGALIIAVLLCGFEWFMLLVATKVPVYTGPAQPGRQIPSFATTLANGKPFTNNDLEHGIPTILVFFRGRW